MRAALDWDYSQVAEYFDKRPGYAPSLIADLLGEAHLSAGMRACDIGAGTGKLTLPLLDAGLDVVAVEPSQAMRRIGERATASYGRIRWHVGRGEDTGLASGQFDLVAFGSSFNVVEPLRALRESARLLRGRGFFACLWNHRRLGDPLQAAIEERIRLRIDGYRPGSRRDDQSATIAACGLFHCARRLQRKVVHEQSREDCLEAWRSHLTLRRQAGERFPDVLADIAELLGERASPIVRVPYVTRLWIAQKRDEPASSPPTGLP